VRCLHRFIRTTLVCLTALFWAQLVSAQSRHCYECHGDKEAEYNQSVVHDPVAKKDCESCHKRHGFSQSLVLKSEGKELCTGCHTDYEANNTGSVVHQAVKEELCWTCHEPHASPRENLIREVDGQTACFVCHVEMVAPERQANVHPPFAEEACATCHFPHAGERPSLVRDDVESLCASCHDLNSSGYLAAHPESARGLTCTTCHDPHNSESPGLLAAGLHPVMADGDCSSCHDSESPGAGDLVAESPDLCLTCHDHIEVETSERNSHVPAAEGECLTCHDPHTSLQSALLVEPQGDLCGQCHGSARDAEHPFDHVPYKDGNCTGCHEPHGGDHEALLVQSDNTLCTSCHTDSAFVNPQHAAAEDDCRTCHTPHASARPVLLAEDGQTLCVACHEIDESRPVGHEPYSSGGCIYCHAPHASDQTHLVRAEPERLCVNCHTDVARALAAPHAHEPASNCQGCHETHHGDRDNLLVEEVSDLCAGCHELAVAPTDGVVHAPYASGDCGGCHNPHGSFEESLIGPRRQEVMTPAGPVLKYPTLDTTQASLCNTCHGDLVASWDSSAVQHQPVADGECDVCHTPHAGHAGLLSERVDKMCGNCHDVGPTMIRKHSGVRITGANCVDCHNPHASDEPALLNPIKHPPYAEGECATCHVEDGDAIEKTLIEQPPTLCANCHEDYAEGGRAVIVHAPVANGDCVECHAAHAGVESSLLLEKAPALCSKCHEVQLTGAVVHRPVRDGECLACHPAHRATGTALTSAQGPQLCLGCHEDLSQRLDVQTVHAPVLDDCGTCHVPHTGDQPALLVSELGSLCGSCHERDAGWNAKHLGGEVTGGCVSCHDPHAVPRGRPALMYEFEHQPFAAGDCESCHDGPGPAPAAVCDDCHGEYLEAALKVEHPHPPVTGLECLSCHRAHASPVPSLLPGNGPRTCGGCHEQVTGEAQHVHPPLEECQTCHAPHGNNNQGMLTIASESELCGSCHENSEEMHFHPMGGEVIDPNTSAPLVCSGCHDPHLSDEEAMLKANPSRELCVLCHSMSH